MKAIYLKTLMTGNEFYTTARWLINNMEGVSTLNAACNYMLWYRNDINYK